MYIQILIIITIKNSNENTKKNQNSLNLKQFFLTIMDLSIVNIY